MRDHTAALDRAMGRVKAIYEAQALDVEKQRRKQRQAIAATIDAMLENMDEDARRALFAQLEAAATARNRRIIETHDQRPAAARPSSDRDGGDGDGAGASDPVRASDGFVA